MSILQISAVKSYNSGRNIEIDLTKKFNLFYGQNGSGKSTISGYFYKPEEESYQRCSFSENEKYRYIVYNSQFVEDSFYNKSEQPGIFTLSQENKDIMEAISDNEKRLNKLKNQNSRLNIDIEKKDEMIQTVLDACQNNIWNKTSHIRKKEGGLGELMTGYLQKASFFQKINQQIDMDDLSTAEIINEHGALKQNKNIKYLSLLIPKPPTFSETEIKLLSTSLTPSGDSYLSLLIEELGNSDWIRTGLSYIKDKQCPFCQKNSIDNEFTSEIRKIFDDTYDKTIIELKTLLSNYYQSIEKFINDVNSTISSSNYAIDENEINELIEQATIFFKANLGRIQEKIDKPSLSVDTFVDSTSINMLLEKMNKYNLQISEANEKVDNYDNSIDELKARTWKALRYMCNDFIVSKNEQVKELSIEKEAILANQLKVQQDIDILNDNAECLRKQVSNIDETITKINRTLTSLGIFHFKIKKNSEGNFFQICRDDGSVSNIYKTLSEGEKTLITFLYFLELCDGRLDNSIENHKEKLIVIDDPISSLSHDYIYEISSLIHHRVIKKSEDFKLIVLTHNLFFFQELIKLAPQKTEAFNKKYQLHRVIKDQHSNVLTMERDDIKNEYEALWTVLKDVKKGLINSVILPNVMRNILEYYFSFSCKMEKLSAELDNLVNSEADMNYKTFYRYINRGSHSDSINISNLGEISSAKYLEMFEGIFKKTNDEQHFKKMLGIEEEEAA